MIDVRRFDSPDLISPHVHQFFFLAYGTGCGFAPVLNQNAPQLGDGPYYGPFANTTSTVAAAQRLFQEELALKRADVLAKFGTIQEGSGKWLPGYFYPKGEVVPFGFGITQTTYI